MDPVCAKAELELTTKGLFEHTKVLASDEYQGRYPGTVGEQLTVDYVSKQFALHQCTGGAKQDGQTRLAFAQPVPLVKVQPEALSNLTLSSSTDTTTPQLILSAPEDFVVATSRTDATEFDLAGSELVFIGYGVEAPEYNWNDYDGLGKELKGKTVICLVNDPGFAINDPSLFNGKAMTYYGRWTYKNEQAGRYKADGVFIVHTDEAAGYPWHVVQLGRTEASLKIASDAPKSSFEGWLKEATARRIFAQAGKNFDECKALAAKRGFKPIPLSLKVKELHFRTSLSQIKSSNICALLEGSDPVLKNDVVIFSAHWDHFGISDDKTKIFHGARDNALGVAALIELSRAFASIPSTQRKRSVLFFSATAEEAGLLGAEYHVQHPTFPLAKTIACINFDILNIFGKTKDVSFYGWGSSELDDLATAAAGLQNRDIKPDPYASNGMFYRSDHFKFAQRGVPSLFVFQGFEHQTKGRAWLLEKQAQWTANCYHKPLDQVFEDPSHDWHWDLEGAVEDLRLVFNVAFRLVVSDSHLRPNWRKENEFRRIRDDSLASAH